MLKSVSALLSLDIKRRGSEYTLSKKNTFQKFASLGVTFIDLAHFSIVVYKPSATQ